MQKIDGQEVRVGDVIEWLGPNSAIRVATVTNYDHNPSGIEGTRIAHAAPDSRGHCTGITLFPGQDYRVQR